MYEVKLIFFFNKKFTRRTEDGNDIFEGGKGEK